MNTRVVGYAGSRMAAIWSSGAPGTSRHYVQMPHLRHREALRSASSSCSLVGAPAKPASVR